MDRNGMRRREALLLPLFPLAGAAFAPSVARAANGSRALVAYLSRSGNTRVVAGQLSRRYQTDLFEIRTAEPYPDDYEATVARARRERDAGAMPMLAGGVPDIARYETVFLGFPIWGSTMPAPMRSFLAQHDLSGKTVVPFITYGSSGSRDAPQIVAALAPNARVTEAFILKCDQERDTLNSLSEWLSGMAPQL